MKTQGTRFDFRRGELSLSRAQWCRSTKCKFLLTACLGVLTIAAGGCNPPSTVISTDDDRLVVVEPGGEAEATFKVTPDAHIKRDGEPAKLEELSQGDSVRVIAAQREGENVALEIVAESGAGGGNLGAPSQTNNQPDATRESSTRESSPSESSRSAQKPALARGADESYQGILIGLGEGELLVVDKKGDKRVFEYNSETQWNIDGIPSSADKLQVDQHVVLSVRNNLVYFVRAKYAD
jgi:hypothetical protein